jgi:MYXO-CTERM domain-containing protein
MNGRSLGGVAFAALALVTVAGGCSSSGSSSTTESVGQAAAPVQGGTTDTAHPFAIGLCVGNGPGQCQGICSGALIAPNLVLTARHCISPSPQQIDCATASFGTPYAASKAWITTYYKMFQGTNGWHQGAQILVPSPTKVCGNDIALIILKDNVSASEATPAAPVVQYSMTDHSRYSTTVTAIGYGITSPSAQDSGTRRIRQDVNIGCIPGDKIIDCGNLAGAQLTANEFVSGDSTCSGDSGSSAYEQKNFNKGVALSFGVLSRGGDQNGVCVSPIYTRTDAWKDFIVATAKTAAQAGGYPAPSWTQPLPPPPADGGTPIPGDAGSSGGNGQLGEACADPTDCASGKCASPSDGAQSVCTQTCDVNAQDCPDGYQCTDTGVGGQCFVKPPTTTTTNGNSGGGGCSVASDPNKPVPWKQGALVLVAAAMLIARRRRR